MTDTTHAINWDMVTEAGFSITRLPSGLWFAGTTSRSHAGVWGGSPNEAYEAFPAALHWRIHFIQDRIARGECYPDEPDELEWLKAVAA